MRFVASIALLLVLGCAGGRYYDRYLADHPGWVRVLPSAGLDLAELVASLQAPPADDVRLLTLKLAILRTDVDPWQENTAEELASGTFEPTRDADYAVIATTSCQSTRQLQSYREVQTSWYLLPKNRLVFWDHSEFHELCVVSNDYVPARVSYAPTEHAVAAIAAEYPKRTSYANQIYRKGIHLAMIGRTEDAEGMLASGDAEQNSGGERGTQIRFDGPDPIPLEQQSNRKLLRARLVEAIAKAKTESRP
jgi:hypothetical protein